MSEFVLDKKKHLEFLKMEREALEDMWAQEMALEEAHKVLLYKRNKQIIYYADLLYNKTREIEALEKELARI